MLLPLLLLACPKDSPSADEAAPTEAAELPTPAIPGTEPASPTENPAVEGRPPPVVDPGPGLGFVDTCGADQHRELLGQPKAAADALPEGLRVRVHCSTCMVTQDFFEDRLNVVYDQETGLIVDLNCG